MSSIILSKGIRNNLLSLQRTADLSATTQGRLATGKKVNSALDNPTNYFTAQSLSSRANDLNGLLDGISNAVKTIEAADKAITAITKLVESAQSIAKQASTDFTNNVTTVTGTAVSGATTQSGAAAKSLTTLGFTAGNTISLTTDTGAGTTSQAYTFTVKAGDTVQTLVDGINGSGAGTASINSDGTLTVNANANNQRIILAKADGTGTVGSSTTGFAALGLTAATTAAAGGGISTTRAALAKQFDDIRTQIDGLAKDAGFNGVNLLNGDKLSVIFNEKSGASQNKLDVNGVTFSSAGLSVATSGTRNGWAGQTDVTASLTDLTSALTTLRTQSATLGSNLSVVQTRQDFTKDLSSTLQAGADNLVLADQNAEAANMLALQTRQSLSQSSMSLANQADQGVLRLLQ